MPTAVAAEDLEAQIAQVKRQLADLERRQLVATSTREAAAYAGVDRSTIHRQRARSVAVAPTISRRSRTRVDAATGRRYGELPAGSPDQRQADAGHWRVGAAVREQCRPLAVAVDGIVARIYPVGGWQPIDDDRRYWSPDLGPACTDVELAVLDADYPLHVGDPLPTHKGGAYRPIWY